MVVAVSLVLGAASLMGLSQGDREQRGYEALSRAAITGTSEELRAPGGLEDSQQQSEILSSSTCSINSGTTAPFRVLCVKCHVTYLNVITVQMIPQLKQKKNTNLMMSFHSFARAPQFLSFPEPT